jgi:hypothetical protein
MFSDLNRYVAKTVQRQHQIRMAAYCHLVEVCEGAESPYGIVLFGDSYQGMAIPNNSQNRKALHEELQKARQTIQAVKGNKEPLPPRNDQICRGCPLGEPVPESQGVAFIRQTHSLPVLVVIGRPFTALPLGTGNLQTTSRASERAADSYVNRKAKNMANAGTSTAAGLVPGARPGKPRD